MFPRLSEELGKDQGEKKLAAIQDDTQTSEKSNPKAFANYWPTIIDFLCRCDTDKQAEEIIRYMSDRGEIDPVYAERLLTQLRKRGVRSFGLKREEDYYHKMGRR